ncbi:hypothetical protein PVAND_011272 [Polypedilum vanderplanki]|uniref:Uncharacterized protein n=1 Tax=Polypedilum vanderplanki TaxID=319348 RepID=A0A9J6CI20_POLVA|nr:hypothetical protein PVAND_011272 [Polypedilum vanderplanki]
MLGYKSKEDLSHINSTNFEEFINEFSSKIVQISTRRINVGNFDPNVTIEATNLIESTVEGEEFKIPSD